MELIWIIIWSVMAMFSVAYMGYLLYQLFYKLKKLLEVSLQLQNESVQAKRLAEANQQEYQEAEPTDPNTLFELLGQRRKRKRQIERKKRDRQRRLISRISKIEIDERFR